MTAQILVPPPAPVSGGCSTAGAFGSGAFLALPALLVLALLRRRRRS